MSFGVVARAAGVHFVCGVPDSLLKAEINELQHEFGPHDCQITANEGAAVGLAIGHYLSAETLPLVFLQNSGLGNAINPLVSLADPLVYSIPLLLLVGWRAEILPNGSQHSDEPQHLRQGQVTLGQLELLEIPYRVVSSKDQVDESLRAASKIAITESRPVALVMRAGAKSQGRLPLQIGEVDHLPTREELIKVVARLPLDDNAKQVLPVIATTGMASRELFEARRELNASEKGQDFYTVGGMGHAVSIATGVARNVNPLKVICLDGDGALLMHSGALLQAARQENLIHVVLDNGVHDSVGGQASGSSDLDWDGLARAFGYRHYREVTTASSLAYELNLAGSLQGSCLIRAICKPGHRADLGRPTESPNSNGKSFVLFLSEIRS